ncbi:RmlC-like cupin domain-containing protein [Mycena latifolia]|nr:RmlC-like cupin domain-containing protein [Mycena latifolia]
MLLRSTLYFLICLFPVYISLALYLNIITLPSFLLNLTNATRRASPSTFHTFAFASYEENNHSQFGSLRVRNEDRHREFEIFSYVVAGELEHKDSMGNVEILKRGDLQLTSAGTGISHSEKTHGSKQVHFLQIWALPSVSSLQPKYFTRHFTDADKRDVWARVVAPVDAEGALKGSREGESPVPVQSPLTLYATLLSEGKSLKRMIKGSKGYIHVGQTNGYNTKAATGATINVVGAPGVEVELKEGDGAHLHFDKGGGRLDGGERWQ